MPNDGLTSHQRWARRNPDRYRKALVKSKFGLSYDEYDALVAAKGSVCWICGTDEPGRGRKSMNVDHDHASGRVRGLLCFDCNNALGRFNDDPELITRAIAYLSERGEQVAS